MSLLGSAAHCWPEGGSLLRAHGLTLYEPADLHGGTPSSELADLREIAAWAVDFLNAPNRQLGRRGPVCPYTRLSMDNNSFLLARAGGEHDVQSIESTVDQYRRWFMELLEQLDGAREQHLLTILILLPGFDRTDSGPLDALQDRLKDAFVGAGLMVGQFHPRCDRSGLWNEDFRPLRAPVPLLAIRQMVSSDLPFLLDSASQLSAYLDRFAPDIPSHVRRLLVARITHTTDQQPVAASRG
jgi:Domain of unknown function (DUF6875)